MKELPNVAVAVKDLLKEIRKETLLETWWWFVSELRCGLLLNLENGTPVSRSFRAKPPCQDLMKNTKMQTK